MSTNVAAKNVTAAGVVSDSPAVLAGVSFTNASANAGILRIYDNATTNSGTILFTAQMAATSSVNYTFPGNGVQATKGLYLHLSSTNTVEGSVQIA